jgi:UDP-N-acetylglucosamine acyltransferase
MIHPTAIIYPNVQIGNNVYIGAYCIIGAPAENLNTWGTIGAGVIIEDNTIITGHVTIDEGVEKPTRIGANNFIMKGVHIGHDVQTKDNVIISPHVIIGGYCTIGNNCKMGMGAIIRNRKVVPDNVQIGMGAVVTRACELWENGIFVGNPISHL